MEVTEPESYVSLQQVINDSNINDVFRLLIDLTEPSDYIPYLNMICNNKLEKLFETISYVDFSIFDEIIRSQSYAKFYMISRTYKQDEFSQATDKLLNYAIKSRSLPVVYFLCKHNTFATDLNHPDDRKPIKIALMCNKSQNIIDVLFNMKIIQLDTLMKPNSFDEFKKHRQRLMKFLRDSSNVRDIFHETNLVILMHIILFEMYYESDDETLIKLVENKCVTERQSSKMRRTLLSHQKLSTTRLDVIVDRFIKSTDRIYSFYLAILSQNITEVESLLPNLEDYKKYDDFFPMYIAIEQNDIPMVDLLLNIGKFNPNVKDYQQTTAYHWAAKNKAMFEFIEKWRTAKEEILTEIDRDLLSRHPFYNELKYNQNMISSSYLYETIEYRTSADEIQYTFYHDPDIFEKSYMMLAIKHNCLNAFQRLICHIKGHKLHLYQLETLNLIDYFPRCTIAVDQNRTTMIDHLLIMGSDDINLASYCGITPLTIAIIRCDKNLIWKLLINGANIDVKIVNNIYFRNANETIQEPGNLVKLSELNCLFEDKAYYDDLFTFAFNFFTKNGSVRLTNLQIEVLEILVQQLALHNHPFTYDSLLKNDKLSDRFSEYYSKCESDVQDIGHYEMSRKKYLPMTMKDFLTDGALRIFNVCKEHKFKIKKLQIKLLELLNNIPYYQKLVYMKFQWIRLHFYCDHQVGDLEYIDPTGVGNFNTV